MIISGLDLRIRKELREQKDTVLGLVTVSAASVGQVGTQQRINATASERQIMEAQDETRFPAHSCQDVTPSLPASVLFGHV